MIGIENFILGVVMGLILILMVIGLFSLQEIKKNTAPVEEEKQPETSGRMYIIKEMTEKGGTVFIPMMGDEPIKVGQTTMWSSLEDAKIVIERQKSFLERQEEPKREIIEVDLD